MIFDNIVIDAKTVFLTITTPTKNPSMTPTLNPSITPTKMPTIAPTNTPTFKPSGVPTVEGEAKAPIYNFSIIVENDTITDLFIENITIFLRTSFQSIFDSYDSFYTIIVTKNEDRLSVSLLSTSDDGNLRKTIHDKTRSDDLSDELNKNVDEYNAENGTHYVVRIELGNDTIGDTENEALSSKTLMIILVVFVIVIAWIIICLIIIYRKRKLQLNLKRSQSEVIADDEIDEPGYKMDKKQEKEISNDDTENNTDNNGGIIVKQNSEGNIQLAEIPNDNTVGNVVREDNSSDSNSSMYDGINGTTRTNGRDSTITMATVTSTKTHETVTTRGSIGIV